MKLQCKVVLSTLDVLKNIVWLFFVYAGCINQFNHKNLLTITTENFYSKFFNKTIVFINLKAKLSVVATF